MQASDGPPGSAPPSGYVADLPYVAETVYTISLSRQSDVSALNTVVTLPVPIAILAPPDGLQVTEGQIVTVQWSPVEDRRGTVVGLRPLRSPRRCENQPHLFFIGSRIPDTGAAIFNVDQIRYAQPHPTPPDARVLRCDIVARSGISEVRCA